MEKTKQRETAKFLSGCLMASAGRIMILFMLMNMGFTALSHNHFLNPAIKRSIDNYPARDNYHNFMDIAASAFSFTGDTPSINPSSDGIETMASFDSFPLLIDKKVISVNGNPDLLTYSAAGDVITYTITVENISDRQINQNSISVTDPRATTGPDYVSGNAGSNPNFEPGEVWTYTATYVVKPEDISTGWFTNTARGTVSAGNKIYCVSDDETVIATRHPFVTFKKSGSYLDKDNDRKYCQGDQIFYSFTVTNLGNLPLTGLTIADPYANISGGPIASLAANTADNTTFTAVYTLKNNDIDAGFFMNTATLSGYRNGELFTLTASDVQYFDRVLLKVEKTAVSINGVSGPLTFDVAGDIITYNITVENTGFNKINRNQLSVTDPQAATGPSFVSSNLNSNPNLEPGEVYTYTATCVVTEEDMKAGLLTNRAVASVKVGNNVFCFGEDEVVFRTPHPEISISKSADIKIYIDEGEIITYTITVKNTGTATLTDITVKDPVTGLDEIIPLLEPGASVIFTEVYRITQNDLDNGRLVNIVTAAFVFEGEDYRETATETIYAGAYPALEIVKEADRQVYSSEGEIITYTVSVENTGNVTLKDILVEDPMTGLNFTITTLAPGGTHYFQNSYTVTQPDISEGRIINTATASYKYKVTDYKVSDTETITFALLPTLSVTKKADPGIYRHVGDKITYTVTVQNTGTVTLNDIQVEDLRTGLNTVISSLAPGVSRTFTDIYFITQQDFNYGNVSNTATATYHYMGKGYRESARAVVVFEAMPGFTMTKTASIQKYSYAGQEITYTLLILNTSNVTLSNILVTDPQTGLSELIDWMPPGTSRRYRTTYVVKFEDLSREKLVNTATARFNYGETVFEESATATVLFEALPGISVSKTALTDSYREPGEEIDYTVVVTNSGNIPLTEIGVSDPLTGLTATIASLPIGASETFTTSYQVTQADLDRGVVENTVTAVSGVYSGTGKEIVMADQKPQLQVAKTADKESYAAIGELITYNLEISNTGNITLSGILVNDPLTGLSEMINVLSPGEKSYFTGSYTVSQSDLDRGHITNIAMASTGEIRASDTLSVAAEQMPALTVTKTSDVDSFAGVGETIRYNITVANTGNVTLQEIWVTDHMTGLRELIPVLVPGASESFFTQYLTQKKDLDKGSVVNIVVASDGKTSAQATHTVNSDSKPELTLTKTARSSTFGSAGEVIYYEVVVSNTGNATLTDVVISDPMTMLSQIIFSMVPGTTRSVQTRYTAKQADLERGYVVNTVTASYTFGGAGYTLSDTAVVRAVANPAISFEKIAGKEQYSRVGETVPYSLMVTNTGNVTLRNISVTDPLTRFSTLISRLTPGSSQGFSTSFTVTQADLDRGKIVNTAIAKFRYNGTDFIENATEEVSADASPRLAVSKQATPQEFSRPGETLSYIIRIANEGNVSLSGIEVTDPLTGLTESVSYLPVGASRSFATSYVVKQSDIDRGLVTNRVTAVYSFNGSGYTVSDSVSVIAMQHPSLVISKDVEEEGYSRPGDILNYTITVRNTGNVTLSGISVNDPLTGLSETVATLAPGLQQVFRSVYTILQKDISSGRVINTASATYIFNEEEHKEKDTVTVEILPIPGISISKLPALNEYSQAGEQIPYAIMVTNTGSIGIPMIEVEDPLTLFSAYVTNLAPGAQQKLTTYYTVKQSDIDRGSIENIATASFRHNGIDYSAKDTAVIHALILPSLSMSKKADKTEYSRAGEVIRYTLTVTNSGNITLKNILVNDPLTGFTASIPDLAPGAEKVFPTSYTVRQVDIDRGNLENTATAAVRSGEEDIVAEDTVILIAKEIPTLSIIKESDKPEYDRAGLPVSFTLTITNTGNLNLTNVMVSDPLTGFSATITSLAPGGVQTYSTSYTITQEDMDNGSILNIALANYSYQGIVIEERDSLVVSLPARPGVTVDKQSDKAEYTAAGEKINYNITLTNSGNVTLTDIQVNDPLTGFNTQIAVLSPGAVQKFNTTYTITQTDMVSGKVVNTIKASLVFKGNPVTGTDTETVNLKAIPAIQIIKTADKTQFSKPGDKITYTLRIENTGNVTLSNVQVKDPMAGISQTAGSLAPGATLTFSGNYTVTQADLDKGSVVNTATAQGTAPDGSKAESEASVEVMGLYQPAIQIIKDAQVVIPEVNLGEVVTYLIRVTNTGNVTLKDIRIRDPLTGLDTSIPVLAPGAFQEFETDYTVTVADEAAGRLVNTATAEGTAPKGDKISGQDTETLTVLFCELIIPNGFSPNSDNIQDTWRIKCIDKYPEARVEIYNRWGNLVFEKDNYGNIDLLGPTDAWWDGYSTHKWTFGSDKLPTGTYFYVLDLKDGSKPRTGFIFLNR